LNYPGLNFVETGSWGFRESAVAAGVSKNVFRDMCSHTLLQVGAALAQLIAEGTVQRSELFITTKLW
jgi:hypothetical protein